MLRISGQIINIATDFAKLSKILPSAIATFQFTRPSAAGNTLSSCNIPKKVPSAQQNDGIYCLRQPH